MKQIAIFGLLVVAAPSWAQYRGPCLSYEPSESEIHETIERTDGAVPGNAQVESACFTTTDRVEGIQTLSSVRRLIYTFTWPTDEVADRTRFHRRAICVKSPNGSVDCAASQRLAGWQGNLVHVSDDMTNWEAVEILETLEQLSGPNSRVAAIRKTKGTSAGQRFAGKREYEISTRIGRGSADGYWLRGECRSAADCDWSTTPESLLWIE